MNLVLGRTFSSAVALPGVFANPFVRPCCGLFRRQRALQKRTGENKHGTILLYIEEPLDFCERINCGNTVSQHFSPITTCGLRVQCSSADLTSAHCLYSGVLKTLCSIIPSGGLLTQAVGSLRVA